MIVHSSDIVVNREVYRFSNTFNIILSSSSDPEDSRRFAKESVLVFIDAVAPYRSIFLFTNIMLNPRQVIMEENPLWSNSLPVFPAVKMVLNIPAGKCDWSSSTIRFICNGNCIQSSITPETKLFLKPIYSNQRKLFHQENKKIVNVLVTDSLQYIPNVKNKKQTLCLTHFGQLMRYCRSDIMTSLLVAQLQNATARLYSKSQGAFQHFKVMYMYSSVQHIVHSLALSTANLPLNFVGQFLFDKFDSTAFLYCDRNKYYTTRWSIQFKVWYEPFTLQIWLMILFSFISVGILLKIDCNVKIWMNSALNFLSSVFGQSDIMYRRYYVSACCIALICLLYENSLLSIISVNSNPKSIRTLKELVNSNYKLIWLTKLIPATKPGDYFEPSFKTFGIDARNSKIFYVIHNVSTLTDVSVQIAGAKEKLAMMNSLSKSDFILKDLTKKLRMVEPSFVCKRVKQTLNPKLYFWKVNAENRNWVFRKISHMLESGLYTQWNKWSDWSHLLSQRLLNDTQYLKYQPMLARDPSYITVREMLAVCFIFYVLLFIAIISLLAERRYFWQLELPLNL
ncbi:unnamed protein product [Orchesella dallaii]|uniref:Uncharacterized protein n=1 Tax=Orchesella dallaii TaxID=48710 RepID=A0ABP1RVI3_9HEXA